MKKLRHHDASSAANGYLYQVRIALWLSLKAIKADSATHVSIEKFDDVSFERDGSPTELIQLKHRIAKKPSVNDASVDLWNTLGNWLSSTEASDGHPINTKKFILTTASISERTAASFLRDYGRDLSKADKRLLSTASRSKSKKNLESYTAYRSLSLEKRLRFLGDITIIDASPNIVDARSVIVSEIYHSVDECLLEELVNLLEGWWFNIAIKSLSGTEQRSVPMKAITAELSRIRNALSKIPVVPAFRLERYSAPHVNAMTPGHDLSPFRRQSLFQGRGVELEEHIRWAVEADGPVISVRILSGAAGVGKTRLALELINHLEGWEAGFLSGSELKRSIPSNTSHDWMPLKPTLIVIDHASQYLKQITNWMDDLSKKFDSWSKNFVPCLRILLIERNYARSLEPLARIFHSEDTPGYAPHILCDTGAAIKLESINDRKTAIAIIAETQSRIGAESVSLPNPEAILELLSAEGDRSEMCGNPLILQIAATEVRNIEGIASITKTDLLRMAAKRECKLNNDEWLKQRIPVQLLSLLPSLRSMAHLMRGPSVPDFMKLIGNSAEYNAIANSEQRFNALSCLSLSNPEEGRTQLNTIDPDLVGDMYAIEQIKDASTVECAFSQEGHLEFGPRIWRLLYDFKADKKAVDRISSWVLSVGGSSICDEIIRLDTFMRDGDTESILALGETSAKIYHKITLGLKNGQNIGELLLLTEDYRDSMIAKYLEREARIYIHLQKFEIALAKLSESMCYRQNFYKKLNFESDWERRIADDISHVELCLTVHHHLDQKTEQKKLVEDAIISCKSAIKSGVLWTEKDDSTRLFEFLSVAPENVRATFTSRGLQIFCQAPEIYDVRLNLGNLTRLRLSLGPYPREQVVYTANLCEEALLSNRHVMYERRSAVFLERSRVYAESGLADVARVLRNKSEQHRRIVTNARCQLLRSFLYCKCMIVGSYPQFDKNESLDHIRDMICLINACAENNVRIVARHFWDIIFAAMYKLDMLEKSTVSEEFSNIVEMFHFDSLNEEQSLQIIDFVNKLLLMLIDGMENALSEGFRSLVPFDVD